MTDQRRKGGSAGSGKALDRSKPLDKAPNLKALPPELRPPGEYDERQIPLSRMSSVPSGGDDGSQADPPGLSDGSVRRSPP